MRAKHGNRSEFILSEASEEGNIQDCDEFDEDGSYESSFIDDVRN